MLKYSSTSRLMVENSDPLLAGPNIFYMTSEGFFQPAVCRSMGQEEGNRPRPDQQSMNLN